MTPPPPQLYLLASYGRTCYRGDLDAGLNVTYREPIQDITKDLVPTSHTEDTLMNQVLLIIL